MKREESKEFETFDYNGDMTFIRDYAVNNRIDKIYNAHEKEIFNIRQEAQKQISELRVEIDGLREKK